MKIKLEHMADFQIGYQTRGKIEKSPNGTHHIIQVSDIRDKKQINYTELMTFKPSVKPDNYLLQVNDILFLARGYENFAFHITQDLPDTVAANAFYIIRVEDTRIQPGFLCWWLNETKAQHYFQRRAVGTSIPLVSKKTLAHLLVPVPPTELQEKITYLTSLHNRQTELSKEIQIKSKQLVTAVCMKAIQDQGAI